jgi:tripartite-type tricarboxylate transporter receptor subunit TctC
MYQPWLSKGFLSLMIRHGLLFGWLSKTPEEIVNKLNLEINKALETKEVKERLTGLGLDTKSMSPSEFRQYLKAEVPKWARAVKDSGATAD